MFVNECQWERTNGYGKCLYETDVKLQNQVFVYIIPLTQIMTTIHLQLHVLLTLLTIMSYCQIKESCWQ